MTTIEQGDWPINSSKTMDELLAGIDTSKYGRMLRSMNDERREICLTAPVAAAVAISRLAPGLAKETHLDIAVVGAESMDHVDYGIWYQTLGWLLGNESLSIDVTFIGPNIGLQRGNDITNAYIVNWPAELTGGLNLKRGTDARFQVETFLNSGSKTFDVALLFNPGFSGHTEWFRKSGIDVLAKRSRHILVSAYEDSEVPDDFWMARQFGFGPTAAGIVKNPFVGEFALANRDKGVAGETLWGQLFWELSVAPVSDLDFKNYYLRAADILTQQADMAAEMGKEAMLGLNSVMRSSGVWVKADEMPPLPGVAAPEDMISLPRNLLVLTRTGRVYSMEGECVLDGLKIPESVISNFPEESKRKEHHYPGLLWSVWVLNEFVAKHIQL